MSRGLFIFIMEIRNIAIIAHVDHGKTTLTDAIMQQTGAVTDESISMDSNVLELERGITIYAKNASVLYKGTKINIVDTPGHSDFGSEVERVLRSIDSVILVVDAQEGPMPQTKYVLKKSLELGHKPIVVINKIDKHAANPDWAYEQVFQLFYDLGATDEQLDFAVIYSISKLGIAKRNLTDESNNITPLLDMILEKVSPAKQNDSAPLRFQPFNLGYDNFLGRLAIGRIYDGTIDLKKKYYLKKSNGETEEGKIRKIFIFKGSNREEVESAFSGDIVMIAGFPDINIGETICDDPETDPMPNITIDEPTMTLDFVVNNSPFSGRDGKYVTSAQLGERLKKELEVNVGLKIDFTKNEFKVSGRGELHIEILIENLRREGYELQVSAPNVIIKEIDGIKNEPFEEVTVDVKDEFSGVVIEKLSKRKGIMTHMDKINDQTRMVFEIPTRGLLGFRGEFISDTKGDGIMCATVIGFKPFVGEIVKRSVGSMVSMASGKALGYSLFNLQPRGSLYIGPATEVYEGMVVGNTSKGLDMNVNPIKGKQLTNMRASGSDEAITLTPPRNLSVGIGLEIMSEDEYLEVTPNSVRLRKKYLTEIERKRQSRSLKS